MFQSTIHSVFLRGMLYLSSAVQYSALFVCRTIGVMYNQISHSFLVILLYCSYFLGFSSELEMNL